MKLHLLLAEAIEKGSAELEHGDISQEEAEQILKNLNEQGLYLVSEPALYNSVEYATSGEEIQEDEIKGFG